MASNDLSNPNVARAAQDLDAPASAFKEPESHVHVGRGGAANVAKLSEEEAKANRGRNQDRAAAGKGEEKTMLGKAKDVMGGALSRVKSNDERSKK